MNDTSKKAGQSNQSNEAPNVERPVTDVYEYMDALDEMQIIKSVRGEAIQALVYSFTEGKGEFQRTVTALSIEGVREAVRLSNEQRGTRIGVFQEPIVSETDAWIQVKACGEDHQFGGAYWGIKREPKQGKKSQWALESATSKAQRNALRGLIPESWVTKMIEEFVKQNRIVSGDVSKQLEEGKAQREQQGNEQQAESRKLRVLNAADLKKLIDAMRDSFDRENESFNKREGSITDEEREQSEKRLAKLRDKALPFVETDERLIYLLRYLLDFHMPDFGLGEVSHGELVVLEKWADGKFFEDHCRQLTPIAVEHGKTIDAQIQAEQEAERAEEEAALGKDETPATPESLREKLGLTTADKLNEDTGEAESDDETPF